MPSEQIDYTQILNAISQKLDGVNTMLSRLNYGDESEGLQGLTSVYNGVDRLAVLLSGQDTSSLDYSVQLNKISQLLAWTDMLLLVFLALMFVGLGLFAGYQVTRWMKARS